MVVIRLELAQASDAYVFQSTVALPLFRRKSG
jgi:hypothetical protein